MIEEIKNAIIKKRIEKNLKEKTILISTILGICIAIATIIYFAFQFAVYIYDMQWFYYWGIDSSFYFKSNTLITNSLIYCFSCICALSLFGFGMYNASEKPKKGKIILVYIFLIVLTFLTGTQYFYKNGIDIYYIIALCIFCILALFEIKYAIHEIKQFLVKKNNNIRNIFLDSMIVITSLFITAILLGIVYNHTNRDYKIIQGDNKCNVVLYLTSDYYIIADCSINKKDDLLTIHDNTIRKIDNYNIIYNNEKFKKIKKN